MNPFSISNKNSIRVLFIFHDKNNYTGGPSINAVRLIPELIRLGLFIHPLCIVKSGNDAPNAQALLDLGIHVEVIENRTFSEQLVFDLLKIIGNNNIDLVISNINTQAALLAKWLIPSGIPVIHTHRSNDVLNNGVADFLLSEDNSWDISGYVFVNEALRSKYDKDLKRKKLSSEVIYSGVLGTPIRASFENFKEVRIVYSGRFEQKQKRILETVDKFIEICQKRGKVSLMLIGDGTHKNEIKSRIEKANLTERISLVPPLKGNDYKSALAQNHFVFLNSAYEGTPGSLMDGMSVGLIPLSVKYEGVYEIIEEGLNGFILESIDALDEFIQKVLENEFDLIDISEKNIELVKNRFSIEQSAKKWSDYIQKIFEQRRCLIKRRIEFSDIKLPRSSKLLKEHNSWQKKSKLMQFYYYWRLKI